MKRLALQFLAGLLIFGILAEKAAATDFESANFISRDPVMSIFGGRSASANFEEIAAGGQAVIGESASDNFILRSGFLYFEDKFFTPKSQNWQWFDDEENETPNFALAPENTAPTETADQNTIKLRLVVKETANMAGANVKFRLQFSEYADFSQEVNDVAEAANCVSNSLWCYGSGAGADNSIISTKILSDADNCSGGIGAGCGTHNSSGVTSSTFSQSAGSAAEYEFTIKQAGARANATYFFRAFDIVRQRVVAPNAGETPPSLSTAGAALIFTVSGLPSGTITEGVTTDAATTPQSIALGSLNFDAETEAAQRLAVTANATGGYQIFILARRGLVGPGEIAPFFAPNEAPAAWQLLSGASGAFGYHAGDDVLSGGSPRFAPDNTYAGLEDIPKEVAFSSGPSQNRITDIIFKAQITNEQEAGNYESSIIYVVVPIF